MFLLNSNVMIDKKLIKLSAYETLLNSQISSLPVDVFKVFKKRNDATLYNSTLFRAVENWDQNIYEKAFGKYGTIIYNKDFDKFFVFYNDFHTWPVIRWELASLLAMLELGLASKEYASKLDCNNSDYTSTFAYYFTAPDIVLKEIGYVSANDIMAMCNIPFDKAHYKSKRLKSIWTVSKMYIDKIIKDFFQDFIELHKKVGK